MNPKLMKKFMQAHTLASIVLIIFFNVFSPSLSFAQPVNNLCAGAISLTSANIAPPVPQAGTLVLATYTATATSCGTANRPDVWYTFVAHSSNPTITLTGALSAGADQPSMEIYQSCGTPTTPSNCITSSATLTASGLIPGTAYLIRVFSNNSTLTTFSIYITDPNDVCGSAVTLIPSTAPVVVPGNMYGAGIVATTINSPNCAAGVTRDVWYKFTAQTTNPTITLTGVLFGGPGIQILSNNCGASFTSYYCGTTSIAADFLTPGVVYFIRVYSTAGAPASPATAGFNITITDPVTPPPSNDECTGAVNLSVANACSTNPGSMAGATPSAKPLNGSCTGPLVYDVWYKFTAVGASTTITLSSLGSNFVNPGIEVFTGASCAALTSIACGANPLTVATTAGTNYFVRIYSRTAPLPNGNALFAICLTSPTAPVVRFGNGYVNLSRKTVGGVVQTGDTLEITMTINHTVAATYNGLRFVDNVPTKTSMLTAAGNFIRILTNEGLTYKQYTLTSGDDAATYVASPAVGQFNIRMNIGFASNPGTPVNNTSTEFASCTGTMINTNRPTVFGSSLLFSTAYRVKVTGVAGDTITLNAPQFIYRTGGVDVPLVGTSYKILISNPLSLCSNSIGLNSAVESGGTFGTGTGLNRGADLVSPIVGYSFVNDINGYNSLGDGRYAVVNNIGPRSTTNRNALRVPNCGTTTLYGDPLNCNNRMHGGHWYIDGDHTGTTNAIGNVPPDDATNSGYMLEVNADYVPSEVYKQTISNLCPNTYYEFSAWFRNICRTCGADSTGAQFAGTPTAPANGYPGVLPNLTFNLNGLDYYNTGQIDTVGWVKRGFVFRTDTSSGSLSATFSIRNNSQGGGGNDWVMDDIAVATCLPTMKYSPTINPNVCQSNTITIADTISSFFKNYTTYKWQKSTDGGTNWTDITGVTTLADTNFYITTYTIPPASTQLADNGTLYRVVVATTPANIANVNCNISEGTTITLTVNNCGIPLKTDLLSFNGKLVVDKGNLAWTTSKEDEPVSFIVERSNDGINFNPIGTVNGHNDNAVVNAYSFIDPTPVTGKVYYRLSLKAQSTAQKYSRIIELSRQTSDGFGLTNVINPFNYSVDFEVTSPVDTKIDVQLIDLFGKVVQKNSYLVHTGVNALSLPNTENLPAGTYIFRVKNNDVLINRKVLKKNL
jgi:hypothetical protein